MRRIREYRILNVRSRDRVSKIQAKAARDTWASHSHRLRIFYPKSSLANFKRSRFKENVNEGSFRAGKRNSRAAAAAPNWIGCFAGKGSQKKATRIPFTDWIGGLIHLSGSAHYNLWLAFAKLVEQTLAGIHMSHHLANQLRKGSAAFRISWSQSRPHKFLRTIYAYNKVGIRPDNRIALAQVPSIEIARTVAMQLWKKSTIQRSFRRWTSHTTESLICMIC